LEALIREACELVTAQIEAEERSVAESGPSGSGRDAEDGGSRHTKDEAYGEAGRDRYHSTTGEGAEEATLAACEEGTAMDEAGDYEFQTPQSGTSYGNTSGIGACAIGDEVAADNDIRRKAATVGWLV
jgi:hypothetical protein